MPNFLDVAAGVVTVPKDGYGTETALNVGPGSLYYKAGSTVSSGSNDGTLTSGSSLSLMGPTSFVAVSQGARLVVSDPQFDEAASLAASVGQPGGVAVFSDRVVAGGTADDTAAVQAVLTAAKNAGGGTVRGIPGTTYKISAPLVVGSNTTLDMTGCTVQFANTSVQTNMLQNAACTPAASATDAATTATSSVVASATLAAVAQANQALEVVAAGPTGGDTGAGIPHISLYGTVQSVAANNITLTGNVNGVAASSTLSGATARLYGRDSNIAVIGGTWDAGTNWSNAATRKAAGYNSHQLRFRRVDGLTVRDVTVKISGFPGGGGWVFGINPGDCTDYVVENCEGVGASAVVQGDGPLYRGIVRDIRGSTQDDMVAFGCVGFDGNDVEGDIIDLHVDGITANNSWRAFKLFGGTGANGAQRIMSGVTGRSIKGTTQNEAVDIIEYAGTTWVDATIEDVTVAPAAGFPQVYISAAQAQTITLRAIKWPSRAGTPTNGVVKTGRPVSNLIVRDLDIRAASGTGIGLLLTDSGGAGVGAYAGILVDGVTQPDAGMLLQLVKTTSARPINLLAVRNFRLTGASNSIVFYNNTAAQISQVAIEQGRADGTNTFLYYNDATSTNALTLRVSKVYNTATSAGAVATVTHPATVILSDSELNYSAALVSVTNANATPVRVLGANLKFSGSSSVLVTRGGTQAVSVSSLQGTVDQTILTPSDGDIVNNSNATPLNGIGVAIFNTAAAKWKNIYSGTTS